jgi:hypothetical protein
MIDMDRFVELGSFLEPGRPPKTDKAAILIDAARMVTQLRGEAEKLKNSNSNLQEKIKELKVRPQFMYYNFIHMRWKVHILDHFISLTFYA